MRPPLLAWDCGLGMPEASDAVRVVFELIVVPLDSSLSGTMRIEIDRRSLCGARRGVLDGL
jgi:hypothetical protein